MLHPFLLNKHVSSEIILNMMSISGRLYSLYSQKAFHFVVVFIFQLAVRSLLHITNKWQIFAQTWQLQTILLLVSCLFCWIERLNDVQNISIICYLFLII